MASTTLLTTPRWALNLNAAVCARYHITPPVVRWRSLPPLGPQTLLERIGHYNHRVTPGPHVVIFDTGNPLENRMTLLHEAAHHITHQHDGLNPDGSVAGHSDRFWRRLWRIYSLYRVPRHAAILTEFGSSYTAEAALRSLGVRLDARALAAADLGNTIRTGTHLQFHLNHLRATLATQANRTERRSTRDEIHRAEQLQQAGDRLLTRYQRAYDRLLIR